MITAQDAFNIVDTINNKHKYIEEALDLINNAIVEASNLGATNIFITTSILHLIIKYKIERNIEQTLIEKGYVIYSATNPYNSSVNWNDSFIVINWDKSIVGK